MLRPRKGGHSWINQAEVNLMYILQKKFRISQPYYFISRMFVVRECNRESPLSYPSMISGIIKHFCNGVLSHLYISPGQTQEFNATTMANMRYKWDKYRKTYYLSMKGTHKRMYNYDKHDDAIMTDAHYGEDEAWLQSSLGQQPEGDQQGWRQW